MTLKIACSLTSGPDSHEHARIAEELGYGFAWFYDSPALYADVWVQLCRAAERTERIGLGPGVAVPALRHPMVTAAAIAQLVVLAGDRVAIGVGTGFTGRVSMGQRPSKWSDVSHYVDIVKSLLRGEQVEWDGAVMQMLHPDGFVADRPIEVPWVFAVAGPKGIAVAQQHGGGILAVPTPIGGFEWSSVLAFGTVLDEGEDPGSQRAIDAAGHGASVIFHLAMEFGQQDTFPRGEEWAAAYADIPERVRHLALHDGHLHSVNERDRPFVDHDLMVASGVAQEPAGWRERLEQFEAAGATDVVYQPAGPDIPRELEAFAKATQR